jgi:hypothetical protein
VATNASTNPISTPSATATAATMGLHVSKTHGAGIAPTEKVDRTVTSRGSRLQVSLGEK